jgi:hypothetical protein
MGGLFQELKTPFSAGTNLPTNDLLGPPPRGVFPLPFVATRATI